MYLALNHMQPHRLAVCDGPRLSKGQHLQDTRGGEEQRAEKEHTRGVSPSRDTSEREREREQTRSRMARRIIVIQIFYTS